MQPFQDGIKKILDSYDNHCQVAKAIEELGELQKPLCRYLETGNADTESITEEMADTVVMLLQLMEIFGITEEDILTAMEYKIGRTLLRVHGNGQD